MDGLIELAKRHKMLVIIAVAVALWIALIVIAAVSTIQTGKDTLMSPDDIVEMTQEQYDNIIYGETFAFTDRTQFDEAVGNSASLIVFNNIESHVLNADEVESAPYENLPAKSNQPAGYYTGRMTDLTYAQNMPNDSLMIYPWQFKLAITDGRQYNIYVVLDNSTIPRERNVYGKYYIAALVERVDSGGVERTPNLYINYRNDQRNNEVRTWLSLLGFDAEAIDIHYIGLN